MFRMFKQLEIWREGGMIELPELKIYISRLTLDF